MALHRRVTRAEILTIVEQYLTRRLAIEDPSVKTFALNDFPNVLAKLQNVKEHLGYNFDFVVDTVNRLGTARAIQKLNAQAQLVIKTSYTKKRKQDKDKGEDDNTTTQEDEGLLSAEDIDTLEDLV